MSNNKEKLWTVLIFILIGAIVAVVGLSISFIIMWSRESEVSQTIPPTLTVIAPSTSTPSAMATVVLDLAPTVSPTSVPPTSIPTPERPFSEEPFTYGHSVNGFPLLVYRLGTGSSVRMIIGGIHGGYEWNTIVLV
ncbi:MAG: hypothetical protein U9Q70_04995, partial [Chloroflexota bacterium]|nr:hypothetical protein [Chloroflexota bacterium]